MRRVQAVTLAVGTIATGLLVHRGALPLGDVARDVAGDALWAAMMYWWITALLPAWHWRSRAATTVLVCWLVELSQLVHTPSLDAIRATSAGRLVLGSGFDARDLVAYVAGVLLAVVLELLWLSRGRANSGT